MAGPRKRDPVHRLRRILVHSTGNAAGQQAARAKRLARATEDLDKLQRAAGGRYYNTAAEDRRPHRRHRQSRRVAACLRTDRSPPTTAGRPTLTWHFDQDVLDAEAAADGWYALLTHADRRAGRRRRGAPALQGPGRRRTPLRDFKGPLAVAPMFLAAQPPHHRLLTVICLALLVFCLIERQVRQALGPEQTMVGLYPDNRKVRPTGRMILYHLGEPHARGSAPGPDPPAILITEESNSISSTSSASTKPGPAGWRPKTPCAKSPPGPILRT